MNRPYYEHCDTTAIDGLSKPELDAFRRQAIEEIGADKLARWVPATATAYVDRYTLALAGDAHWRRCFPNAGRVG